MPAFQAADILNAGFRYLEYLCDQLHGRIVRMILIAGRQTGATPPGSQIHIPAHPADGSHPSLSISSHREGRQAAGFLGCFQQSAPSSSSRRLASPSSMSIIDLFPVKLLCPWRLIVASSTGRNCQEKFPGKISRTIHDPLVPDRLLLRR